MWVPCRAPRKGVTAPCQPLHSQPRRASSRVQRRGSLLSPRVSPTEHPRTCHAGVTSSPLIHVGPPPCSVCHRVQSTPGVASDCSSGRGSTTLHPVTTIRWTTGSTQSSRFHTPDHCHRVTASLRRSCSVFNIVACECPNVGGMQDPLSTVGQRRNYLPSPSHRAPVPITAVMGRLPPKGVAAL